MLILLTSRPTASALSSPNRSKTRLHRPSGWSRIGSKRFGTRSNSGCRNELHHADLSRRGEPCAAGLSQQSRSFAITTATPVRGSACAL